MSRKLTTDSAYFTASGGNIVEVAFPNRVGVRGLVKVDPPNELLCAAPAPGIERLEGYFALDASAAPHEWEMSA